MQLPINGMNRFLLICGCCISLAHCADSTVVPTDSGRCFTDNDCSADTYCWAGECLPRTEDGSAVGDNQEDAGMEPKLDGIAGDQGIDGGADSGMDGNEGGDAGPCVCGSGPCCDACHFRLPSFICQSQVESEFGCPWGTDCGQDVGERFKDRYCTGSSAACDGALQWGAWMSVADCTKDQKCIIATHQCQRDTYCASDPQMVFTPAAPLTGQAVRVDVVDVVQWNTPALTASGPCGAVSLQFLQSVENPPGIWTWSYSTPPLTGGSYSFTFTSESGSHTVVSNSLTVSGCTDCVGGQYPIYGIFGWAAGAGASIMNGKRGWSSEFLRSQVEFADSGWWNARMQAYAGLIGECFTPITRLSYDSSEQEIPQDLSFCDGVGNDDFAVKAAAMASDMRDRLGIAARRFVIANEPNQPSQGARPVSDYVSCYLQVYQKIKAAWPEAVVMPAAVAPWPPKDYDCAGDTACSALDQPWKRYAYGMYKGIGTSADAYAVHAYGGRNGDTNPYDDNESSFGVFATTIGVIDLAVPNNQKPVYITIFNHNADGSTCNYGASWANFMQNAYRRINDYNGSAAGRIKSLCWFAYSLSGWDCFNLTYPNNSQALSDFQWTTGNTNYLAP